MENVKLARPSDRGIVCIGSGYKEANLHQWGPGCRDFYSLHYIVSGRGYLETKGNRFFLEEGDTFLVFPAEECFYYPDTEQPWEYVWVDFYGPEAERLIRMTDFVKERPVMEDKKENRPYFEISGGESDRVVKEEREAAKLYFLLTCFFRQDISSRRNSRDEYMVQAKEYIRNQFWRNGLTVPQIAAVLNVERTYLYRIFKENLGMSPQQYLKEFRMERACVLLEDTGLPIQSVACSVGYEDALYFSRVFRKAKGMSPSDYRLSRHTP